MNAVSIRRNRLLAGLFAAVIATTGIVAGAAPASADKGSHRIDYVALGDSYAAGQGGGYKLDDCAHTKASYPRALDRAKHVKLIADATCTGVTSEALLKVVIPKVFKKLKKAELVTITVGGADLLQEEILVACGAPLPPAPVTPPTAACEGLLRDAIAEAKHNVLKALVVLRHITHKAKIVVTGYPRLYEPSADPFRTVANAAIDGLNKALYWAVEKSKKYGAKAKYVDVAKKFAGHGIGSSYPWIHPEGHPDQWHPTKKGHEVYAHLVARKAL